MRTQAIPRGGSRARGKKLNSGDCRRIRDAVAGLLVHGSGLTIPEAAKVLNGLPTGERNLRRRLEACPVELTEIVGMLCRKEP